MIAKHLQALLAVLALVLVIKSHATEPALKPNILFILADDLGWGDLRCYGNSVIDTPTLDGLAKSGIRFTDYYSPSPLCAPARASLLTGRHNHRTGAVDVPSNRGLDRLDSSEKTFGDYFRHAGYSTALIGKWHNGLYHRDHLPHRRGFDSFYGFPNGGQDYWKWNLLRNDDAAPHDGLQILREKHQRSQRTDWGAIVKTCAVTPAGRVDHLLRFHRAGQRNFRLTRRVNGFTDNNRVHRAPN